jgi:hypothetical protein
LVARSPRLRRVSLRKKPCISELNHKVGQIQIQFFGKVNGGSFQFFPPMILFSKNHWTKPVFRRGERYLSILAEVQSNCFPFAQNQTFFVKVCFCFDEFVFLHKVSFFFNTSVQKSVDQFIKFGFRFFIFSLRFWAKDYDDKTFSFSQTST